MHKLKHLHPVKRWRRLSRWHRFMTVLILLAVVVFGLIGWAQYQDAQNEQLLRDISADFTELERQLEQELGVEVENKSGCFTTSEKFNEGKTACYFRLEPKTSELKKIDFIRNALLSNENFSKINPIDNTGYTSLYSGEVCTFGDWPPNKEILHLECPVPVRAGNADFVRQLL